MREYEPIWIALKKRGEVFIKCPEKYQRRIRKAVIKEKDRDESYKILCRKRLKITPSKEGLKFTLQDYTPMSWILARQKLREGNKDE